VNGEKIKGKKVARNALYSLLPLQPCGKGLGGRREDGTWYVPCQKITQPCG